MAGLDKLFTGLHVSASGLSAERMRMDVIAENIANARTTRTPDGGPYRRKLVVFEPLVRPGAAPGEPKGVRASRVLVDRNTPTERVHEPGHPDADANGMVELPNVNTLFEMADLITSMRAYEAGMKAQESYIRSAERALDLLR